MGPMARARPRLQTGRLQLQVRPNLQQEERAKKMEEMEMGRMKREERRPFRQINHLFLSRKRREKRKMMMTRRKVLVK